MEETKEASVVEEKTLVKPEFRNKSWNKKYRGYRR